MERHIAANAAKFNVPGPLNPNWRGGPVITQCEKCGKDVSGRRAQPRRFCSIRCALATIGEKALIRSRLRYENEAVALLEIDGWRCLRSAGSRGPTDVFAFNSDETRLIQVKSSKYVDSPSTVSMLTHAILDLQDVPDPPHISKWIYFRLVGTAEWFQECISDYPRNKEGIRKRIRAALYQWRDSK